MSEQLEAVIARLDGVRRTSRGCSAKCPAHSDRTASLSVADGEHGVVLTCYAGCAPLDVLTAIGLSFSDLYPPRERASMTHAERSQARIAAREATWAASLVNLARDTLTVQAAAGMLANGHTLSATDYADLTAAATRIAQAKDALCGRR